MKKIEVYIQWYTLDQVAKALAVEGVVGMSVTEAKGFGVERGFTRGEQVQPDQYVFHPKMKVEMVVEEAKVDKIVDLIKDSLKTGQVGEGKIFVTPVDDAIRTRTGERGEAALR
jgi:nitrogen regulatory protein P-II 1